MRIAYCTNVRLPSERAHGHQIAQVCNALVHNGHTVTIFCPYRVNPIKQTYHAYYAAQPDIKITYVGTYDYIGSTWFPGMLGLLWLNRSVKKHLQTALEPQNFDAIYTRSDVLLAPLLQTGLPVLVELHHIPKFNRKKLVQQYNKCARIVCLTSSIQRALTEWGVNPTKLVIEGDGVDLARFTNTTDVKVAQKHFKIQTSRPIVGYVGRLKTLGQDKGVRDLLQALVLLKKIQPYFGFIVGGPACDVQEYQNLATELGLTGEDVLFTGAIDAIDVPTALTACTVLAMPWPDKPHYRHNMSPLKMFEYMAAQKPILTSDLPTIRDVLDESTAFFCEPDSPDSIAEQLQLVAKEPELVLQKLEKIIEVLPHYSWQNRMERILTIPSQNF